MTLFLHRVSVGEQGAVYEGPPDGSLPNGLTIGMAEYIVLGEPRGLAVHLTAIPRPSFLLVSDPQTDEEREAELQDLADELAMDAHRESQS